MVPPSASSAEIQQGCKGRRVPWHPLGSSPDTRAKLYSLTRAAQGCLSPGQQAVLRRCQGLCSDGGCAQHNTPLGKIQVGGLGRYVPAWCQRDMSHYLANLCPRCILQVSVTAGLYPEARVSICMDLHNRRSFSVGETNYPWRKRVYDNLL